MPATTTPQTGDVVAWGGLITSPPANWLHCGAVAVSRTTYAALFAAIGTTFGAGDGSTTFNLPNGILRIPRGKATPGGTGGMFDHSHSGPTHPHTATQPDTHANHATDGAHTHNAHTTVSIGTLAAVTSTLTGPLTHASQGGHNHTSVQNHSHAGAAGVSGTPADTGTANPPYQTVNYIIRI